MHSEHSHIIPGIFFQRTQRDHVQDHDIYKKENAEDLALIRRDEIVCAVDHHRDQDAAAQHLIPDLQFIPLLRRPGDAVVVPHKDAGDAVERDRGPGAHAGRQQSRIKDIHDVFHGGEAQRSKDSIDDTVEAVVKIRDFLSYLGFNRHFLCNFAL